LDCSHRANLQKSMKSIVYQKTAGSCRRQKEPHGASTRQKIPA
jgi:hypothetical protein